MRCPDCSKFVSYDDSGDPEVDVTIDEDGNISGTVRIILTCAECGTELKAADFDVSEKFEGWEGHVGDKHDLSVETGSSSISQRRDNPGRPARYQRQYYGHETSLEIHCSCQADTVDTVEFADDTMASGMEECV